MPFGTLWLPVLVSAVLVWLVSALLHMVLRYHRADYRGLPDEEGAAAALGHGKLAPGVYPIPYCPDARSMKDPAVQGRYARGPVAIVTVMRSGVPNMGVLLTKWFAFCFLVSFIAAYLARHTLAGNPGNIEVMRVTGAVAFVAYGLGDIRDTIWKANPAGNAARAVLDALVYAVVTGGVFLWLWPR